MTLDNSSEYPGDSAFGNSFGDDLNLIRKKFPKLEAYFDYLNALKELDESLANAVVRRSLLQDEQEKIDAIEEIKSLQVEKERIEKKIIEFRQQIQSDENNKKNLASYQKNVTELIQDKKRHDKDFSITPEEL